MNLNEINNVSDLINANQVAPDCDSQLVDKVLSMIDNDPDITPEQILLLATNLVAQVGAYHFRVIESLKNDPEQVAKRDVWIQDEQKIHTAYDILNEVNEAL